MHYNDYDDCDDYETTQHNNNFFFLLETLRENKDLNKQNTEAMYKMELYLTAFIHLSNAIMEYSPTSTWPMASEMGDPVMGQDLAKEFIAEFAENCKKARPTKKKK